MNNYRQDLAAYLYAYLLTFKITRIMKKLLWLLSPVFLISCQETYVDAPAPHVETQTVTTRSYTIPPDTALSRLKSFLAANVKNTRNGEIPEIEEIYPVVLSTPTTRTVTTAGRKPDTTLYVANYTANSGFAIITADSRIEDEIIAVIEDGNLPAEVMNEALQEMGLTSRPIDPDYPTTGPEMITISGQKEINPNTFSLYTPTRKDSLVGNYTKPISLNNYEANNTTEDSNCFIEKYISTICLDYAIRSKKEVENKTNDDKFHDQVTNNPLITTDPDVSPYTYNTYYEDWTITEQVQPLLSPFEKWTQGFPFNNLLPAGKKTGCVPLAIAKIMTFFKTPQNFIANGYKINWEALTANHLSAIGSKSAAYLLKNITNGTKALMFSGGTFTFPCEAIEYMKGKGFPQAKRHRYTYTLCMNQLKEGKPLLIYAIPKYWDITKSHCWNIDGYKIQYRNKVTECYDGTKLISTRKEKKELEMLHCDMGWGGKCNGYYVSGVFKPYFENTEFDNPDANNTGGWYYVRYMRLIAY